MYLHELPNDKLMIMARQYVRKMDRMESDLELQVSRPLMCQDMRDAQVEITKEITKRTTEGTL
jgi:hypothetical protein